MNLRYFVFLRWAYFTKTSQVFDTLDRLSLFWEIRSAFRQWRVSVFGVGFTMAVQASVKSIVKSTTAKLSEKIAPHRDENVPAIETSGGWASRLAGLLSKNKQFQDDVHNMMRYNFLLPFFVLIIVYCYLFSVIRTAVQYA